MHWKGRPIFFGANLGSRTLRRNQTQPGRQEKSIVNTLDLKDRSSGTSWISELKAAECEDLLGHRSDRNLLHY
jgi:hypothetical protein